MELIFEIKSFSSFFPLFKFQPYKIMAQRSMHFNTIYQPLRSGRIWHKVNF